MAHKMRVRRAFARSALRVTRWRLSGDVPQSGILVGAPHTSQWDWVIMLLIAWGGSARPKVLVEQRYFKGVVGWILLHTGGIPLDRANPGATIRALLKEAEGDEPFLLAIAAEGTRSKGEYWKPGFYKIAQQTGLPIGLQISSARFSEAKLLSFAHAYEQMTTWHKRHPATLEFV